MLRHVTSVSRNFVAGCRPRIRRLFSALNLDCPGLERVREAWLAGKAQTACIELVAYFEGRRLEPSLLWEQRATAEEHRRWADGVLKGEFELQGLSARVPIRPDGGLDWNDRGPHGDPEWTCFLNRHDFFRSLLRAWRQTGDEHYRTAIGDHLVDWVNVVRCPPLPTWKGTWRSLEVARRCTLPWLEVFFCQTPRPAIDPEAKILMLSSIHEHGRLLRRWHARRGNHLFTEVVGLAVLAAAWPEFRQSAAWLEYAASRACRALFAQTYADGAHVELSNHYQRVVLMEAERLATVLSLTELRTELESVRGRLTTLWDYFAEVSRPDGYGPLNNDGDLEPNAWYLIEAGKRRNNPQWLHIATGGAEGLPPADPPSRFFPWSGQAVMRSGWNSNAQWARFDMGPHGTDHQHDDQLSIELYAGGRPFLVDPGRYTYQSGRARDYFRGPTGHNVIRVNGQGSVRPPYKAKMPLGGIAIREREYDFFCHRARFRGRPLKRQRGCLWRRAVVYVRGKYWIVVDHLETVGPMDVTATWLFHPDCTVTVDAGLAQTRDEGKSNLAVVPAGEFPWRTDIYRGQKHPLMRGWYSESYNQIEACSQVEYHASIEGSTAFGWVLFPLQPGVTLTKRTYTAVSLSQDDLSVRISIALPGGAGEDIAVMDLGGKSEIMLDADTCVEGPCAVLHQGPDGRHLIGRRSTPGATALS